MIWIGDVGVRFHRPHSCI